jgi:pimeloyl-ACP methyl ester carboxylesterase
VAGLARHGVRAVLMPKVGHFAMLEDPDAFNRVLAETIEEFEAARPPGGRPATVP